jgi:hypothetical protein
VAARREVIAMNWLGKLPRRTRRSCRFDTRDEPNMRESDYSSPSETCESRTSSQTRPRTILGQESWVIRTSEVEAAVTRQAGHLAPVRFRVGNRWIEPFAIAPWANEDIGPAPPQVMRVMRGDFFCLPFGGNRKLYRGEEHPPHGETANAEWELESISSGELHLSMRTSVRKGRVDKFIRLVPGHTAIYSQHVISGMNGRMPMGHHPILRLPEGTTGRVGLSRFRFGEVFPGAFENPAGGGYSILKSGAQFTSLEHVPQVDGKWADLSVYPAREGYEDLVLMASDPARPFAWTALTVPEQKYVWIALKDPRVLPSTVFWMSNGGRHYPPWNGRHRHVIGLEEVAANFDYGLAESVAPNRLNRAGLATCLQLNPRKPLSVNYIMAVAEIPRGFDVVKTVEASADQNSIRITAKSKRAISIRLDVSFLAARSPAERRSAR